MLVVCIKTEKEMTQDNHNESPNAQWKRLQAQSKKKLDNLVKNRTGNKMNAKGQHYNGKWYHSTGEMNYAISLDIRKSAGDIADWKGQEKIELKVNGMFVANYYMDFLVTHNDGSIELVEYKGMVTPLWEMKFNLLKALKDELYPQGVTITLVKHKSNYNPFKRKKP